MDFQDIITALDRYWARQGCALLPSFSAARLSAAVPLCLAGAEAAGGRSPDGLPGLYRYRVLLRPALPEARRLFLAALGAAGLDRAEHDLRWLPFDGPDAAGWELLLDGSPLARFSYCLSGGRPAGAEITLSLERLALASQKKRTSAELAWTGRLTYGALHGGEAA